jgi:hypothetical protein
MTDCVVEPGQPYIAPTTPQQVFEANLGWNAGGNSDTELDGDCHFVFTMGVPVVGAIGGFKTSRGGVGIPESVTHGFLFQQLADGTNVYSVVEFGQQLTTPVARSNGFDETFEIRRYGSKVAYYVTPNGGTQKLVYSSLQPSTGTILVGVALYAGGDSFGVDA